MTRPISASLYAAYAAKISTWRMKSFFSSADSVSQGLSMSLGHGASLVSAGITPRRFWFSKMRSRSFS